MPLDLWTRLISKMYKFYKCIPEEEAGGDGVRGGGGDGGGRLSGLLAKL